MLVELTPQEQKAKFLETVINQWPGAAVAVPFRLRGDRLIFQVLHKNRDSLFGMLAGFNWLPQYMSELPGLTYDNVKDGALYQILIPPDPIAVPDDRVIASKQEPNKEVEGVKRYLRGDV
jgi:hypothetical protein